MEEKKQEIMKNLRRTEEAFGLWLPNSLLFICLLLPGLMLPPALLPALESVARSMANAYAQAHASCGPANCLGSQIAATVELVRMIRTVVDAVADHARLDARVWVGDALEVCRLAGVCAGGWGTRGRGQRFGWRHFV